MIKTLMMIAALAFIPTTTYAGPRLDPDTLVQLSDGGNSTASADIPTTQGYLDTAAKLKFRGQVEMIRSQAEQAYHGTARVTIESVTFSQDGKLAAATLAEYAKGGTAPRVKVTVLAMLQGDSYQGITVLVGPGKP